MSEEPKMEKIIKACRVCGQPIEIEVPEAGQGQMLDAIRRWAESAKPAHDVCDAGERDESMLAQAEQEQREREAVLGIRWQQTCPEEFRKEIDYNDPDCDPKKHMEVLRWTFEPRRGLILAGPTGRCKTRFMFDLLKREHFNGREYFLSRHPEWRLKASTLAGDSQDKLARWIHRQSVAPLWLLDDLGKGTLTPASEEALESVIDQRSRNRLPMIFTTNDSAESLGRRLSADRGTPMIRRILDSCDVVRF